jgi:hypothetical protein
MSNIASNCQRSASLEVDIVAHDLSKMSSNISHNSIGTIKRNGRPATNVAAAPGHNHPPSKKSPQAPLSTNASSSQAGCVAFLLSKDYNG